MITEWVTWNIRLITRTWCNIGTMLSSHRYICSICSTHLSFLMVQTWVHFVLYTFYTCHVSRPSMKCKISWWRPLSRHAGWLVPRPQQPFGGAQQVGSPPCPKSENMGKQTTSLGFSGLLSPFFGLVPCGISLWSGCHDEAPGSNSLDLTKFHLKIWPTVHHSSPQLKTIPLHAPRNQLTIQHL